MVISQKWEAVYPPTRLLFFQYHSKMYKQKSTAGDSCQKSVEETKVKFINFSTNKVEFSRLFPSPSCLRFPNVSVF